MDALTCDSLAPAISAENLLVLGAAGGSAPAPFLEARFLRGPGDQLRSGEPVDPERPRLRRCRLIGIGADDLDVGPRAQRNERVTRASPRMLSTGSGADAEQLFDRLESDAQIRAGIDEVIKATGKLKVQSSPVDS